MATPYSDVYDLFMLKITDYRLIELYQSSVVDFENFLQGWLKLSIADFLDDCDQDLTDRNDTANTFNFDMTDKNQVILAVFMVFHWLEKEVNDVLQMNLSVTDRDFKHYAESKNLDSKTSYRDRLLEEKSQILVSYGYKNIDWDAWFSGNFEGS